MQPHNQLRILLVGKFSNDPAVYTYPSSFIPAFEGAGAQVATFNLASNAFSWIEKIALHFGTMGTLIATHFLNKRLAQAAKNIAPNILFIIKGTQITASTLRCIKAMHPHIRVMHFYPDNPFCFWNGNSNAQVLNTLPYIDLFLIWSRQLIPIIQSAGCHNVAYFPFAFDSNIYHPNSRLTKQEIDLFTSDVVFIGTWDTEREALLLAVINALPSINLAIWGNRWHEYLPAQSPLRKNVRGKAIYKEALLKAFAGTKIVLNFIRPQNLQAHNMRTFEALATGNFLLTQKTTEQSQLPFIEDFNIACFTDADDLVKKIAFYVNQDSLRKEVALRGLALAREFTLQTQVRSLLTSFAESS